MPFDGVTKTHKPTLAQQLVIARIRYARNKITAGRWCQKTINDRNGNRCVVGWLYGPQLPNIGSKAIQYVWRELPKTARQYRNSVHDLAAHDLAQYNDTHKRNTIIRLLNRAIVAMETMDHA